MANEYRYRLTEGTAAAGDLVMDKTGVENAIATPLHVVRIPVEASASSSEQDTNIDLPAGTIVLPYASLYVRTAESTGGTKTIDIGLLSSETGGDADGFLDGVSVSSTGGVAGSLASAGQTLGALLRDDEDGAGVLVPSPHVVGTAVSVTYTFGSNDFAELDCDILIPCILP